MDERLADTIIHRIIDTLNPELRTVEEFDGKERKREFYALSKEDAYDVLHAIAELTHTEGRLHLTKPTGEEIEEERSADEVREVAERKRRKNFTFDIIGIEPGTELACLDRPDQVAVVVDNRHVEYAGEVMTTTRAAEMATGVPYAISGPEHWTYHGKTRDQLQREIEG